MEAIGNTLFVTKRVEPVLMFLNYFDSLEFLAQGLKSYTVFANTVRTL